MKVTEYLIRAGGAQESEREVIDFGLQMLYTVLIGGIVVLLTGICLGMLVETLVLVLALLPLRQYTGGLHFNTRTGCGIASVILFVGSLLIIKYAKILLGGQLIIYILGALFIGIYAPVDNENNPLDDEIKNKFGRRARIILGVESAIFVLFLLSGRRDFSQVVAWAVLLIGVLAVLGDFKNKIMGK